ncbi:LOW QUALITY PROTEIN: transport ATP-binding protein CydC [Geomicrobium sp. JCM 19039]|nr:LOW QUALITY PROTEIN: transport ATP-binding protein CydC [Geomicrobium sp. JCM 19039]
MKALIPYVKMAFAERRDMLLSILTGFIAGIAAVSLFSASGLLISRAALTPPIYTLMVIVAIVKLLGVTAAISRYGERYFSHRATFTMLSNIRLRVYEKLEPVASRVLSKIQSGDLMSRIVGDVESLQHVLLRVIYPPVVMLTVFIATITFTFTLSFGSAVVILAGFVLVLVVIPTLFFIGHRRVDSKLRQTRGSLSSETAEFLSGFKELVIHGASEQHKHVVHEKITAYEREKEQSERMHIWSESAIGFLSLIVSVGVLAFAGFQVAEGNLAGTLLAMLLMISLTVFEQVTPMALFPYYVQESSQAAKRLEDIDEDARTEPSFTPYDGDSPPSIQFDRVSFSFPDFPRPVLESVSFAIAPGSHTAIIGASGSGKSTIASLLLKLQPVDDQPIYLNNTQLDHIDEQDVWQSTNVSLQSNQFFVGSVNENLAMGNDRATAAEMTDALASVELDHLNLSDALHENAANLSGGEKQRLALARLFLRDASLWVLDEPTSSLDALTEQRMLDQVFSRTEDATVVLISHRLTGLEQMDQIIVVDHGQIIEAGSYDDLIAQNGYLKQMKDLESELFAG